MSFQKVKLIKRIKKKRWKTESLCINFLQKLSNLFMVEITIKRIDAKSPDNTQVIRKPRLFEFPTWVRQYDCVMI